MIRHRFGGILRAARIGILCRRPSRTHARTRESFGPQLNGRRPTLERDNGQRTAGLDPLFGRATDAPTEIDPGTARPISDEEEIE
jgi:hypothetical protein